MSFKVGDKVRIKLPYNEMEGHIGYIEYVGWGEAENSPNVVGLYTINPPTANGFKHFYAYELELVDDKKPLPLPG